jgi:hypothetical protein
MDAAGHFPVLVPSLPAEPGTTEENVTMSLLHLTIARSSLPIALVTLLAACNSGGGGGNDGSECQGVSMSGSFDLVEPGKSVQAACLTFGSYGLPDQNPAYHHSVDLRLDGDVRLGFWFPNTLTAPATLDFSTTGDFGAELFDYQGFEGGSQPLCDTAAGFPPNAGTKGTITIESFSVGADGFLTDIHAKIDVSFAGCSVDAWAVSSAEALTVRGDL